MKQPQSVLAAAIERQDWEAAAVCLLLGVARKARTLPPGAIDEVIEALAAIDERPARRRKTRGRRH